MKKAQVALGDPMNDQLAALTPGPQSAVWALMRDSRGRVLLARRDDESPAWNIPGGSIEMMTESAKEAVVREVHEEVGLHVRVRF